MQAFRTPLCEAAFMGRVKVATLLIKRGAKVDARDKVRANLSNHACATFSAEKYSYRRMPASAAASPHVCAAPALFHPRPN